MRFHGGITFPQESSAMFRKLQHVARFFSQGARLMVGVPDYDNYVALMARNHPGQPVMSQSAFFRERQEARYGKRSCTTRCC